MTEEIQRKLTAYVQALPEVKQRRFNEGLQRDLCASLADRTVVLKAKELQADQYNTERQLYEDREKLLRAYQGHPLLEQKLLENDKLILKTVDDVSQKQLNEEFFQLCTKQQEALRDLQVPAFRVTPNPKDIELQMSIFEFILSIEE